MHGSRPAAWRRRWRAALWLIALTVTLVSASVVAAEPKGLPSATGPASKFWSGGCPGRGMVRPLDRGPWPGARRPSPISWRGCGAAHPAHDAERAIEDFAQSQGASKTKSWFPFSPAFGTLNDERTQVIEGLLRFGANRRNLPEKYAPRTLAAKRPGKSRMQAAKTRRPLQGLGWDMRVFDERRQSLTYVCETPALIEHRLFALARVIQRSLE